jgi:hypothetical protein
MKTSTVALVLFALAASVSYAGEGHKFGKQVRYVGIHAIPKSAGGGMCYIEGPHVHTYPANKLEYREHEGDHYFVGDPVAYGYDGPKYSYKGPHPIHVDAVVGGQPDTVYCYIEGPHFHYFQPPEGPEFKVAGDAYFYVGDPPQVMVDARPQYVGINAVYTPLVYTRPVVEVDAPVGWIGARAEFVTPGVGVVVGVPGAVVVGPRGRAEVVAPGVAIGVGATVAVPMPSVHVGVGVGIGGPVVHERETVIIRDHHDNGRHEGWHKGHK